MPVRSRSRLNVRIGQSKDIPRSLSGTWIISDVLKTKSSFKVKSLSLIERNNKSPFCQEKYISRSTSFLNVVKTVVGYSQYFSTCLHSNSVYYTIDCHQLAKIPDHGISEVAQPFRLHALKTLKFEPPLASMLIQLVKLNISPPQIGSHNCKLIRMSSGNHEPHLEAQINSRLKSLSSRSGIDFLCSCKLWIDMLWTKLR